MHLCRSSSNVPRLPSFLDMLQLQNPHVLLTFDTVHNPFLHLPHKSKSERQKVVRACGVFNMFTSRCASRHNGVHFFDIATSKSGPNMRCFVHFDLEIASRHHGLASWLRTRRFSEPTFRPSGAQIMGKTQRIATFLPFRAPASYFF